MFTLGRYCGRCTHSRTLKVIPTPCLSNVPGYGYCIVPSLSFDGFKKLCLEGRLQQALDFLYQVPWNISGASSSILCNCILQGCIRHGDLDMSRKVYALIISHGWEKDSFLGTSLLRIFGAHGLLADAVLVFGKVEKPDAFLQSALIYVHSKNGHQVEAISLYQKMTFANFNPDSYLFVAVLKACADSTTAVSFTHGKLIHHHVIERGLELAPYINNVLINMYGRYGALEDAHSILNQMPEKNVSAWSAIIGGYSNCECGPQAFQLFLEMQNEGIFPDQIICVSALKACCGIAALHEGKLVHSQVIESGFELNAVIGSALIDMYAKCGHLEDAKKIFGAMQKRDVVTWSAMMAAYTFNSECAMAMECYHDMKQEGCLPNEAVFVCVLSACNQLGLAAECDALVTSMTDEFGISPTKEHLNCVISLLGQAGCMREAESILRRSPFQSNVAGWTALLNSCKTHGEVEVAKLCFDHLIKLDCRDASPYALMVDIYSAKGMWEEASNMKRMRESAQAWKKPGRAFIQVYDTIHEFVVLNSNNNYTELYDILAKVEALHAKIRQQGYVLEQNLALESQL